MGNSSRFRKIAQIKQLNGENLNGKRKMDRHRGTV